MTSFVSSCFLLALLLLCSSPCSGYRVGDAVDTFYRTEEKAEDALRNQMPLFGVNTMALFQEFPRRFSLSFEEGLRPLPWVPTMDGERRSLMGLQVIFVFSRGGDGVIHAVSSKPRYEPTDRHARGFAVEYKWVEEEELDPKPAMILLFLVTFVSTIFVLLHVVSSMGGDTPSDQSTNDFASASIPSGMPKWD